MATLEREYWTPPQIAAMTGIKLDNILKFIHSGELRASNTAVDPNGQRPRWRIAKADLQAFLDGRANRKPEPIRPARRRRTKPAKKQWV